FPGAGLASQRHGAETPPLSFHLAVLFGGRPVRAFGLVGRAGASRIVACLRRAGVPGVGSDGRAAGVARLCAICRWTAVARTARAVRDDADGADLCAVVHAGTD